MRNDWTFFICNSFFLTKLPEVLTVRCWLVEPVSTSAGDCHFWLRSCKSFLLTKFLSSMLASSKVSAFDKYYTNTTFLILICNKKALSMAVIYRQSKRKCKTGLMQIDCHTPKAKLIKLCEIKPHNKWHIKITRHRKDTNRKMWRTGVRLSQNIFLNINKEKGLEWPNILLTQ